MSIINKFAERRATVGILGMGYVGIPLALRINEVGMSVVGFDVDEKRVDQLNDGKSPIKHIKSSAVSVVR